MMYEGLLVLPRFVTTLSSFVLTGKAALEMRSVGVNIGNGTEPQLYLRSTAHYSHNAE